MIKALYLSTAAIALCVATVTATSVTRSASSECVTATLELATFKVVPKPRRPIKPSTDRDQLPPATGQWV